MPNYFHFCSIALFIAKLCLSSLKHLLVSFSVPSSFLSIVAASIPVDCIIRLGPATCFALFQVSESAGHRPLLARKSPLLLGWRLPACFDRLRDETLFARTTVDRNRRVQIRKITAKLSKRMSVRKTTTWLCCWLGPDNSDIELRFRFRGKRCIVRWCCWCRYICRIFFVIFFRCYRACADVFMVVSVPVWSNRIPDSSISPNMGVVCFCTRKQRAHCCH